MKSNYYLAQLTDKEVHNLLMKRGVRGAEARLVKEQVAAFKAEMRKTRARKRAIEDLWKGVLHPLSNEQRSVRSSLRYESSKYPNPQRREALNAYIKVLAKVKEQLREYRYYKERTPKEQAAYLKEKGKTVPNDGEHWTDWVPLKVKTAIAQAFIEAGKSAPAHARIKEPFPRTMTKADNHKLRYTHIVTAKKELREAEQELNIVRDMNKGDASEAERDAHTKVKHIQNILNWLICAESTEIIPRTWGELLVADLPKVTLADE